MLLRSFLIALVLFIVGDGYCQKLTVVVNNIRNDKGYIRVALYNSGKSFMINPFRTAEVRAKEGHVMVVFQEIPEGEYAATVLHDLNGNKAMDENLLGIPKEGFGFSNDAMGPFGPPGYRECIFPVKGNAVTTGVKLKHF